VKSGLFCVKFTPNQQLPLAVADFFVYTKIIHGLIRVEEIMEKHHRHVIILIVLAFIISTACGIGSRAVSTAPGSAETAAAQTWSVMQRSAALSATPTFTPLPATDTPIATATPTNTNTPTPTNTLIPVLTQLPTFTPSMTPTRTLIPTVTRITISGGGGSGGSGSGSGGGGTTTKPCYAAEFSGDLTIPNGQIIPPNTSFTKIWRIKNVGSCTWPKGSYMVPTSGNGWVGDAAKYNNTVKPGKSVDYKVDLVSPMISPGSFVAFKGNWLLRVDKNTKLESRNRDPFLVSIHVTDITAGTIVWDFVNSYCSAKWEGTNDNDLDCPSSKDNKYGFVRRPSPATLEGPGSGLVVPAAIWSQPASSKKATITGTFSGMYIPPGTRLRASVGCLHDKKECDVQMDLSYRVIGGDKVLINSILEEYDGVTHTLVDNFDLSPFAGNYVSFIFEVKAIGDKQPAAAWYHVQLYRP
jgi:hypothetical protein